MARVVCVYNNQQHICFFLKKKEKNISICTGRIEVPSQSMTRMVGAEKQQSARWCVVEMRRYHRRSRSRPTIEGPLLDYHRREHVVRRRSIERDVEVVVRMLSPLKPTSSMTYSMATILFWFVSISQSDKIQTNEQKKTAPEIHRYQIISKIQRGLLCRLARRRSRHSNNVWFRTKQHNKQHKYHLNF